MCIKWWLSHHKTEYIHTETYARIQEWKGYTPTYTFSHIYHIRYHHILLFLCPSLSGFLFIELWGKFDDLSDVSVHFVFVPCIFTCLYFLDFLTYSLQRYYLIYWLSTCMQYLESNDILDSAGGWNALNGFCIIFENAFDLLLQIFLYQPLKSNFYQMLLFSY